MINSARNTQNLTNIENTKRKYDTKRLVFKKITRDIETFDEYRGKKEKFLSALVEKND